MRHLTPRVLILLLLTAALMTSCVVGVESRPVDAPREAMPEQPMATAAEKVVSLATLTGVPTFDPNNPGPTPTAVFGLPGATPAPTRTPLAPSDSLAGMGLEMGMIADPYAQIQLSFPAGWSITPVDEAIKAEANSYITLIESPPDAVPSGIPMRLELVVLKGGDNYEKALELRMEELRGHGWVAERSEGLNLPSGEPANIFWLTTPEGQIAQMVTVINGNTILLTGMGDLFLFNPIAASLQRLTASKPGG